MDSRMTPEDLSKGYNEQQRRSLEREIEQRVRAEAQVQLDRKISELDNKQAYID